jgi:hypothetical protein
MTLRKRRRRAPDFQGNAPSKTEQLPGRLDQEITLDTALFQAAFLRRRFEVAPLRTELVASLCFGGAR